jgi:hypothetical protein
MSKIITKVDRVSTVKEAIKFQELGGTCRIPQASRINRYVR